MMKADKKKGRGKVDALPLPSTVGYQLSGVTLLRLVTSLRRAL